MAATTFHKFAHLPYEIRHQIWELHLPAEYNPLVPVLINALASHILAIPPIDNFHRLSDSKSESLEEVVGLTRSHSHIRDSPWAGLAGCSESRTIALKQVQRLLEKSYLSSWLNRPKFFYHPKLMLDASSGALMYHCNGVTDKWEGEYHLEMFVFWRAAIRWPGAWIGPGQLIADILYEEKMKKKAADGRVLRALIETGLDAAEHAAEAEETETLSLSESSKRKREEAESTDYEPGLEPDPASFEPLGEGVTWCDEGDDEGEAPASKHQKII